MNPRLTISWCGAVLLLAACAADLPHRWTDAEFGFEVHSDFARAQTALLFDDELGRRVRALCAAFGVASLRDVDVFVHDQEAQPRGADASVVGWHDRGEVHLLAAWNGAALGLPDPATEQRFGHELVHALVALAGLELPRWLEEGLCEVLSASPIDADGRLVPMPNGARERELRRLRAQGRWLDADTLLLQRDGYPDDPQLLPPMYAEGTSLCWLLLAERGAPTRALFAALAELPEHELRRHFAAWEGGLDATSVAQLLAPFAAHHDAHVRLAVADGAGTDIDDAAWWPVARALLADPEARVRQSARIRLVYRPVASATARAGFRRWADDADRNVQLAGLLALAQCGDLDAAIQWLRALRGMDDADWWQPLVWLVLLAPGDTRAPRAFPDDTRARGEADYLRDYGQSFASDLERLRPRLRWDDAARRWRLQ